ncbi:MAG: hypothetical protein HYS17_03810 [Micavibrio aeruginosavorus]|uniref:Uncharacterized protein n=1 Tax=Micavibrio aeruginosavorus TaxID=349221 RepID=A0A7T5R3L3_9BACT|nr:MAG: hypothetical protein HYS17_03810 [Micavibrio aeruginosavorus]
MIVDMDIIMTGAGQIVLVVPGEIPAGALEMSVQTGSVTLAADGHVFVSVADIDAMTIDALAGQNQVDLIAVPDADHPPAGITHRAAVRDDRIRK